MNLSLNVAKCGIAGQFAAGGRMGLQQYSSVSLVASVSVDRRDCVKPL